MVNGFRRLLIFIMYIAIAAIGIVIGIEIEDFAEVANCAVVLLSSHVALFFTYDVLSNKRSCLLKLIKVPIMLAGIGTFLFFSFALFLDLTLNMQQSENAVFYTLYDMWPVSVAVSYSIHKVAVYQNGMGFMSALAFPLSAIAAYVIVLPIAIVTSFIDADLQIIRMLVGIAYFILLFILLRGRMGRAFANLGNSLSGMFRR